MKSFVSMLAFLLLNVPGSFTFAQTIHPDSTVSMNRLVYAVTQQPPGFYGGILKLNQYLRKNIHYPKAAQKARLEGRLFVAFIINEQGSIEEAHVLKSFNPAMDAETVRIIKKMPNWIPGKVNGKPVACRYNLAVNFSL